MTNNSTWPVVAVFAQRSQAESAIDDLWHEGFSKDQVGMAAPGEDIHQATTQAEALENRGAGGAAAGAIAGTGLGALAGTLAVVVFPGLGAVLAGGLLAAVGVGAGAGAALGSFAGPFLALGLSEEQAHHYEAEVRGGRTVVVVKPEAQWDKALRILHLHEPVSVHGGNESLAVQR